MSGKQKGGAFEREVCRDLSLWISKGKREDLFWRSAMSGGRATVAAKSAKQLRAQCGDITAVDPLGHVLTDHCYLECKHLKHFSLDDLIRENAHQRSLPHIWKTTRQQANQYNKIPMLIFRQNRWPTVLCTTGAGIDLLDAHKLVFATAPKHMMRFVRFDDLMQQPIVLDE